MTTTGNETRHSPNGEPLRPGADVDTRVRHDHGRIPSLIDPAGLVLARDFTLARSSPADHDVLTTDKINDLLCTSSPPGSTGQYSSRSWTSSGNGRQRLDRVRAAAGKGVNGIVDESAVRTAITEVTAECGPHDAMTATPP